MSLQPLDMQLSVHRTPEQSTVQSQAVQRPMAEQQMLGEQASKETERQRSKNGPVEHSTGPQIHADEGRQGGSSNHQRNSKKGKPEKEEAPQQTPIHPFKGHHIDISL